MMENINNYSHKHNNYKNNCYHKNNYHHKNNKYCQNYYWKKKKKHQNNVLLSKETLDVEQNELLNENVNSEQEYEPVKKKDDNLSADIEQDVPTSNKLPVFKMALGIVILCAIVFGVSYSFFNFYKVDTRQADISGGEVYIRVSSPPETTNISLNKMYPRTTTEARSRSDNYIDFVIKAKNTSATKVLYYTINIINGEAVQEKNRVDRQYIKYDLQEKVNGEYVYITEAGTLSSFNFSDIVPVNTTSELTREYRLRMWMTDTVLISDTENGRTFTQSEFANLYANYHIEVASVDKIPATMSLSSNSGTINVGENTTATITSTGDGAKTCSTSDNTKATCSINENTLTINGVGEGTATITVNQAASAGYTAASATYNATVSIPTASQQIAALLTETTDYGKIYTGSNPDNYVWFNNEQWRIIGVYNNQLKIVKATPLASQTYNNSNSDGNVWETSRLATYLNQETEGGYYYSLSPEAKGMIVAGTWNAGAASYDDNASEAYNNAIQTQVTNKKVGLIATYEFLYAAGSECQSVAGNYESFDTTCGVNDWLKQSSLVWTLSPDSRLSSLAWGVYSDGVLYSNYVDNALGVLPAVYLDSSITITGGNGKSGENNSYKLG